jgi:hypothetical protein
MPKKTKPYKIPKDICRYADAAVDLAIAGCTGTEVHERTAREKMAKARKALEKWCKANDKKLAKLADYEDDEENADGDAGEVKPTHGWS